MHRMRLLTTIALLILAADTLATEVRFRFRPEAEAKTVSVAGTFNGWNNGVHFLEGPDGEGIWTATVDLEPGTYQYKFVVNRSEWFTDVHAEGFTDDGFGGKNSVVIVGDRPLVVGEPGPMDLEIVGAARRFEIRGLPSDVNSVSLAGDFNEWDAGSHVLAREGDVWWIEIHLRPGNYAYQFVLDGLRWIADPGASAAEPDGFGGWRSTITIEGEQR